MEDKFGVNKRRENSIYLVSFLLSAVMNIAFWINFPDMIRYPDAPEDVKFIYIGACALLGGTIALIVHFMMFLKSSKNK